MHKLKQLIFCLAMVTILSIHLPVLGLSGAATALAAQGAEHNTDHSAVGQHEEQASTGEHGDSAGRHGGEQEEHHIWWQVPGYEIILSALSCLYFVLFIIIVPVFIGQDLEEQH